MRRASSPLTILAEIDPAMRATLVKRLEAISAGDDELRLDELPDTHFTRFVIIDDHRAGDDDRFPALLAWESNHDGGEEEYLLEVASRVPAIDRVFQCCAGYPRRGAENLDEWLPWMKARSYRSAAFFTAYGELTRDQVHNDRAVHEALRTIIDRDRAALCALPAVELRAKLVSELRRQHPELDLSPQSDGKLRWRASLVLAGLLAIPVLPLIALLYFPWRWRLLKEEAADNQRAASAAEPTAGPRDPRNLWVDEDRLTQNQLTHVVNVKPGWFRVGTLWIVLTVIHLLARLWYVRGDLGGIQTIHFARWVIVRDRRHEPKRRRHRLIFFSNYDGSWESYLGEFIDHQAGALSAVWSNTEGFPITHQLRGLGARDEEGFKRWTREHQVKTQVWWTGISGSTVQNVRDDLWIRRRIEQPLDEDETRTWLRRL